MSLSLGSLVCLKLWQEMAFGYVAVVCLHILFNLSRSPFMSISYTSIKETAVNS